MHAESFLKTGARPVECATDNGHAHVRHGPTIFRRDYCNMAENGRQDKGWRKWRKIREVLAAGCVGAKGSWHLLSSIRRERVRFGRGLRAGARVGLSPKSSPHS